MKTDDARSLDRNTLEALRIRAVRSVQGMSPELWASPREQCMGGWRAIGVAVGERDETLVEQWLKKDYPKIKALAQKEKADIYFGDAAHIRSDHHAGRT